jgi:hypothetical protein
LVFFWLTKILLILERVLEAFIESAYNLVVFLVDNFCVLPDLGAKLLAVVFVTKRLLVVVQQSENFAFEVANFIINLSNLDRYLFKRCRFQ